MLTTDDPIIKVIAGIGTLKQMLDCIGGGPIGSANDHTVAKILVDSEIDLRALMDFTIEILRSKIPAHLRP